MSVFKFFGNLFNTTSHGIGAVSGGQKVFKDVKVVIVMMEAALISSSAKIQNVLEQWSWVLDFILSELRGDCNGEPVNLRGKNSVKRQWSVF